MMSSTATSSQPKAKRPRIDQQNRNDDDGDDDDAAEASPTPSVVESAPFVRMATMNIVPNVPNEAVPTAASTAVATVAPAAAAAAATVTRRFVPDHGELGKLLFVQMQNTKNVKDVETAFERLFEMVTTTTTTTRVTTTNQHPNLVISLGGHSLLLLAMDRFRSNSTIQKFGCSCVGGISKEINLVNFIVAIGGFEALVNAIQCHLNDVNVVNEGINAINTICDNYIKTCSRANKEAVDRLVNHMSIIDHIVTVMEKHHKAMMSSSNSSSHSDDDDDDDDDDGGGNNENVLIIKVQKSACNLLYTLSKASNDRYRDKLKQAIPTVGKILMIHGDDHNVELRNYAMDFMNRIFPSQKP